ncbi:MAG: D-alanine--D-alanine ligase [Halobacteriovoraceae bacterium]|nr:D-alanine--D-alanine ligase [Halobacteriovoraceae bacterium]|tara:strand:- start:6826 stop:7827 length:1002 start_codon:yes stop_codon:yes gene_type:complete
MPKKNILLICGGGGTEHEISIISAKYFLDQLRQIEELTPHYLCIEKDGRRTNLEGQDCELRKAGEIFNRETKETITLDYAIPCIHGPPGENGQIQSVFELMGLPYLGAGSEASIHCFNKVTTKLWLSALGIANSPSLFCYENTAEERERIEQFFKEANEDIFIKASNQGSSVGCYHVTKVDQIDDILSKALSYSSYALVEKTMKARELEVSVFEFKGEIIGTFPGEISCPSQFYSYEEKYSSSGKTKTLVEAPGLSKEIKEKIQEMAIKAFKGLNLKDLARIDFFLTENNEIYINEINTFPGHTPISMFPMMMENHGIKYGDFLKDRILTSIK